METINIELKNIQHTEYFYATGDNPTPEQVNASNFLARLTQAAMTEQEFGIVLSKLEQTNNGFTISKQTDEYIDPATGIKHTIKTFVIDTIKIPGTL